MIFYPRRGAGFAIRRRTLPTAVRLPRADCPRLAVEWRWVIPLSDSEWTRIAQCSGLPDEARPRIETIIELYKKLKGSRPEQRPFETRDQFNRVEELARELGQELRLLTSNDAAVRAFIVALHPENRLAALLGSKEYIDDARQKLEETIRQTEWLLEGCAHVELTPSEKGPHTRDAYWLVDALDSVLEEFTGEHISRSGKRTSTREYITAVVEIADPTIGPGTIDEAMKKCISRLRGEESR
jgi:hypothetical protein